MRFLLAAALIVLGQMGFAQNTTSDEDIPALTYMTVTVDLELVDLVPGLGAVTIYCGLDAPQGEPVSAFGTRVLATEGFLPPPDFEVPEFSRIVTVDDLFNDIKLTLEIPLVATEERFPYFDKTGECYPVFYSENVSLSDEDVYFGEGESLGVNGPVIEIRADCDAKTPHPQMIGCPADAESLSETFPSFNVQEEAASE